MTAQSVYSEVAPDGAALVYSFKQLDPGLPNDDPGVHLGDLEDLLDRAQPGWRDLVLHRRFLPHIEAVSALPTAATGGFSGRPLVTVPEDPTVYLAGDWVGPAGFLIDACTASARQAAEACISQLHTRAAVSV
jgi:phytoene dehydrogenase-like protein